MSCTNTITFARPTAWAFRSIALVLSSVTAVSVGLAMFALVEDRRLALLFATAAVLLDVFKYLAWPFAAVLLGAGRRLCAVLLVACALLLAGVSCWATYDRLMTSIVGSRAEQQAVQSQRVADLEAARADDARRVAGLDAEAESVRAQALALRERGMVSKATELEAAALPRIAEQREQARARLDRQSLELTALRAKMPKGAGLPLELATLLCLGFAFALEVVPALILTALRPAPSPTRVRVADLAALETVEAVPATLLPAPEARPETPTTPATLPGAGPAVLGDNAELLQKLLQHTAEAGPGALVTLREFAKTAGIGNLRAGQIFRMAVEAGALAKTVGGRYAVCRDARIQEFKNSLLVVQEA
ncbi:hypothetical protein [Azotobacter beijerinckii]|uniref:Uncharacterized protein n=1 Tax=Azotobacter beijerinckii TaxID=170623 RepID=A0A1I4II66_9GAMM|nr:hypothetical protein [Azotobacter beijerinckii]SFL53767.1 hypothetical protein SAMN04244574_04604 [Azotobacter beijerinckii]